MCLVNSSACTFQDVHETPERLLKTLLAARLWWLPKNVMAHYTIEQMHQILKSHNLFHRSKITHFWQYLLSWLQGPYHFGAFVHRIFA
jgi:hypothetical protein